MKSYIWGSVELIRRDGLWSRNFYKVMGEIGIYIKKFDRRNINNLCWILLRENNKNRINFF